MDWYIALALLILLLHTYVFMKWVKVVKEWFVRNYKSNNVSIMWKSHFVKQPINMSDVKILTYFS